MRTPAAATPTTATPTGPAPNNAVAPAPTAALVTLVVTSSAGLLVPLFDLFSL